MASTVTTMQPKPGPWGEMKEIKDPKFIKFGDGEVVTGMLMAIERATVNGKPASRYLVLEEESREPVCFLGTFQIDSRLLTTHIGHRIMIRCEGTDPRVVKNGNAMKIFRVYVSENKMPLSGGSAENDLGITDADIPF
jgi:hypothetical protein